MTPIKGLALLILGMAGGLLLAALLANSLQTAEVRRQEQRLGTTLPRTEQPVPRVHEVALERQ